MRRSCNTSQLFRTRVWCLAPAALAAGDVNGDAIPDFALADPFANAAFVLVGATTDGTLSYSARRVLRPTGTSSAFGWELALGDLDGFIGDETQQSLSTAVAVARTPAEARSTCIRSASVERRHICALSRWPASRRTTHLVVASQSVM